MVTSFLDMDHFIILVNDLANAHRKFERLGFSLTPRGEHAHGMANHTATFDGNYLELLTVANENERTEEYARILEGGDGPFAIVLRPDDSQAVWSDLKALGLSADGPTEYFRPVSIDGSDEAARFIITRIAKGCLPGVTILFCEHLTPTLVWRRGWGDHVNGAKSIMELSIALDQPRDALGVYTDLLGENRVGMDGENLTISFPDTNIRIVPIASAREKYSAPVASRTLQTGGFFGATIKVTSVRETAKCFSERGIDFLYADGGRLHTYPRDTCGVLLEWAEER